VLVTGIHLSTRSDAGGRLDTGDKPRYDNLNHVSKAKSQLEAVS